MADDELTLEELSERTGVESRTLRSWVSEGLLAPPLKQGRGATYPASNADRALAVRALKDLHGLTLSEIGRRFIMATEEEIREWALEAGPSATARGSARDYLSKIKRGVAKGNTPKLLMKRRIADDSAMASVDPVLDQEYSMRRIPARLSKLPKDRQADLASIERLILQLEKVLEVPAPRRSRGTIWTRISVTPDLEISVRGDLSPRERVLFEQLADQFRAVLTGRSKDD